MVEIYGEREWNIERNVTKKKRQNNEREILENNIGRKTGGLRWEKKKENKANMIQKEYLK